MTVGEQTAIFGGQEKNGFTRVVEDLGSRGFFAGWDFGFVGFDEVLCESGEEELEFEFGDGFGQWVSEVVLVGVVVGCVVVSAFAFGDDVVFEGYGVFVGLHDDEFAPPPGEVDSDGDLVSPGGDAVDDSVFAECFDEVVEGREEGGALEVGVVLVEELLGLHGFAFGCEFVGWDFAEGDCAGEEPLGEGLVHGGDGRSGGCCREGILGDWVGTFVAGMHGVCWICVRDPTVGDSGCPRRVGSVARV